MVCPTKVIRKAGPSGRNANEGEVGQAIPAGVELKSSPAGSASIVPLRALRHSLQYSRMDRDTMEFFQTLFDSFKREMHQEFENLFARLDRMKTRTEPQGDPEFERWKAIERWAARSDVFRAER